MVAKLKTNVRKSIKETAKCGVFFLVSCVAVLLSVVVAATLRTSPAKVFQVANYSAIVQILLERTIARFTF